MSGGRRSALFRGVLLMGMGLVLLSAVVAAPVFTHGSAADTPFGSSAFGTLWSSIEPTVPNFWGPAFQPAIQEPYQEATNGSRLVQYFDKARMEQTTASGSVTNGLLTVEMVTGQRQMGDTSFTAFSPSALPVVGDPANTWPPYSAFGSGVFAAKVNKSGEPTGTVYKPDGMFGLNPGLGADPGAAFGSYQSDPGGRFAHNIPLAFWSYLAALPLPWQTAMGFPLTEAVWVNVILNTTPTWVLVQPFERRVLSYTPTNPAGFQVEMGNIGQHYYQWRYMTNPGGPTGPATTTPLPTVVPTAFTMPNPSATPTSTADAQGVEILNFRQTALTDTTFSFSFRTNLAATSYIRYGTSSSTYPNAIDIATTRTTSHVGTITGLTPNTLYYFTIRVSSSVDSINRTEDYFVTMGTAAPAAVTNPSTPHS